MNDKILNKKLKSIFIFSLCILILLSLFAFSFTGLFLKSIEDSTNIKLENEVQYYKGRITRQIDRNFEILETISIMISDNLGEDEIIFINKLKDFDDKNSFISLSYFDKTGRGYVSLDDADLVYIRNINNSDRYVRDTYLKAIKGQRVISDTFVGALSNQEVFMIAVPVYSDNELAGVLTATDVIEAFSEEINNDIILYGHGHLHLIDSDGNFLVDGHRVIDDIENIFNEPYLNQDEITNIKDKMAKNEKISFDFTYNNIKYQVALEPLGVNGWYLFCINSLNDLNHDLYTISFMVILFFFIILLVLLVILMYVYKTIKKSNEDLKEIACYDRLTKINNLYNFLSLAKNRMEESDKYSIAIFNVKHFKYINEVFGRENADNLLKRIAVVLNENLDNKVEFACRESSDIFYLYLSDTNKDIIIDRLNRIIKEICNEFEICNSNYQLVIRCGAAIASDGDSLEVTMNHAMFAMAKNKESNRDNIWFFDSKLHEQEIMDNYIESHANEALEKREFKVYLQSKINFKTGEICGVEALARWIKDDGTIIYPGTFISLFEKNGFTIKLDLYMFEEVCRLIRNWIDNNIEPVPVSINQSKLTLFEKGYIDKLVSILEKYDISAKYISLEILERLAMDNIDELNIRLNSLKKIGFRISLDDFGTGYSSLNALGKLNVDEIKIDRSFLNETINNKNERQQLLMKEIINFSSKLNIKTVVEGVETEADYKFAKEIGSDIGQGYYFDKPLSAVDFTDRLKKGKYYD